jgi:hypothetical protein
VAPTRPKKKVVKAPEADAASAAPVSDGPVSAATLAALAPEPAAEAPVEAAAEAPEKKAKPGKAFFRDGAEYVCTVCSQRYFTKIEVTKCFEGH